MRAYEQNLPAGPPIGYAEDPKDPTIEGSTSDLRHQLAQVRRELAEVAVLAPSTIRDESDYQRDVALLNDNARQISMRISKANGSRASDVRLGLCRELYEEVFATFDPSLEQQIDKQFREIYSSISRPSTAHTWKAITVSSLPLANASRIAAGVQQKMALGTHQLDELEAMMSLAILLHRAVSGDGKGFEVVRDSKGQYLMLARSTR